MKQLLNTVFAIIIACLACIQHVGPACADNMRPLQKGAFSKGLNIREPVWAGRFYPASQAELERVIDNFTRQAKQTKIQIPRKGSLKALILPHAGYIYSGLTAAHSSLVLKENQFEKVILMGPDHRIGFNNGAISDVEAYRTPFGLVKLSKDAAALRSQSNLFRSVPDSDMQEHSLEVVLPFLQHYLKNFEFIPIVLGRGDVKLPAHAIEPLLDKKTLLVASSDLSHHLSYSEAVHRDKETINMILNLKSDNLLKSNNRACGIIPILIVLEMAGKYGWQPVLLHYSNSGDTTGGRARVVGYAAIAFYGDLSMQKDNNSSNQISDQHGLALVKLARQTILKRLGRKIDMSESDSMSEILPELLMDEDLQAKRGTFVTLKIDDRLRGCIGSLSSNESIVEGVRRNAINAAFHDPRFSSLTVEESDNVDIEISILTEPQLLEYIDGADLISKLRVDVDGVIIRKGAASSTFLPQVWKQLPQPEMFLSQLCLKAGLSADTWRKAGLEVKTYQVQYFEENK